MTVIYCKTYFNQVYSFSNMQTKYIHSRTKIFAHPKPNLLILPSFIFQQKIDLWTPCWARLKTLETSFQMMFITCIVFCPLKMKNKNHQNFCPFMTWCITVKKIAQKFQKKHFVDFFNLFQKHS